MKQINELIISKNEFFLIENQKKLQINRLFFHNLPYVDPFYIEKINYFIENKIANICFNLISNIGLIPNLKDHFSDLTNAIIDSSDFDYIVTLLNFSVGTNNIKHLFKNFSEQQKLMFKKLMDLDNPIYYLKLSLYYTGIRWLNNNNFPMEKRIEIENKILSYDPPKNSKDISNYISLLISYCSLLIKGRWTKAEEKVFKRFPQFTKSYIEGLIESLGSRDQYVEEMILKINDPELYFKYFQNILKKPWEDFRGQIDDKLIDAAILSIESSDRYVINYAKKTGRPLKPEVEERIISNLGAQLADGDLGNAYEIGNSKIYEYIKITKKKSPLFEKILLDYSNKNGGLKITGIPYDLEKDDGTDKHYRTLLDEAIYNYTITNRGGTWPEIGINNRQDLLKLQRQIVDHDTLQFSLQGYGELDY
jgi:hypothetical protein